MPNGITGSRIGNYVLRIMFYSMSSYVQLCPLSFFRGLLLPLVRFCKMQTRRLFGPIWTNLDQFWHPFLFRAFCGYFSASIFLPPSERKSTCFRTHSQPSEASRSDSF